MNPIERSPMATTPANTPGPMIETRSSAQISELIEREETMMRSAMGRAIYRLGVVLRAAMKATGTAMMMPIIVPSVAMFRVSHMGHHSFSI